MQPKYEIIKTSDYKRTSNKYIKRRILKIQEIETCVQKLIIDKHDPKLNFKKINCKQDKNRYSIKINNQGYRVLLSIIENEIFLRCICDHDEYDRRNKDC
ncbi:MAG: hypothetical protein QM482_06710 [Sulfurospirillum sp.]